MLKRGFALFITSAVMLSSCVTYEKIITHLRIDQLPEGSEFESEYNEILPYFQEAAASSKVLELPSGKTVTNVSWFGFDQDDSTEFLYDAVNSHAEIILIPQMDSPWRTSPLGIPSNKTIYFQKGAVLEAIRGEFLGRTESLLTMNNAANVKLIGYGASLKMWKKDYQNPPYDQGQWRHAVRLLSSRNIIIAGLTIKESGGDGIYVGKSRSGEPNYSQNITLKDLHLHRHHRQGISVISVKNLNIENVLVTNTSGTPPEAGIDFEPNNQSERLEQIRLRNCRFVKNQGPGFLISLQNFDENSIPVDIYVEDSEFHGKFLGVAIMNTQNNPRGQLSFKNVEGFGMDLKSYGKNLKVIGLD